VSAALEIVIADVASAADRQELEERLFEYNRERTGYDDGRDLSCFIRDADGALVAGIDGFTWGSYARIVHLWVEPSRRGEGLGSRLIAAAEKEARARGCVTVVLSPHEFQAPERYASLGYEVVGETVDTPRGYRELTFQKRLEPGR
jgi:GNAT superfamily N-acetyltransferase